MGFVGQRGSERETAKGGQRREARVEREGKISKFCSPKGC